jgi:hypothetical protein
MSVAFAAVAGSLCLLQNLQANTPIFVYGDRDLMLCFRKVNADGFGTVAQSVIEVDIGPALTYYGAAIGSVTTITRYSTSLLNNTSIFDSLNDMSWSVSGCVPYAGDGGDQSIPAETLWVTAPRPDAFDVASPWVANGSNPQAGAANEIASIEFEAGQYSAGVASNAQNTGTAIVIPVGQVPDFSCDAYLGVNGNLNGRFQGDVETTTPPDFTAGTELPSRADFYQLEPSSGGAHPAGVYLGYFELSTNGSMVFYRLAGPPPTITVTVSGTTSTISFPTVTGAAYTLHYTNAAGLSAPISTWTTLPGNISGNGAVQSFQVTTTDANRFYSVQDH